MNYELAKQLKGAGWKFNLAGEDESDILPIDGYAYEIPTLSELIEVCGDIVLWKFKEKWYVGKPDFMTYLSSKGVEIDTYTPEISGSTPKEAVAKLWLKLNKK